MRFATKSLHFATKVPGVLLAQSLIGRSLPRGPLGGETLMKTLVLVLSLLASFVVPMRAATAETVLSVVVQGEQTDVERSDLDSLTVHTITTGTDWTDGVSTFKGPLVRDVLNFAGVKDGTLEIVSAKAANDYTVDIPAEDFAKYDVILATEMDGKQLTLRDKGPLWIVYPRDDHSELDDPVFNARWIWQLVELSAK